MPGLYDESKHPRDDQGQWVDSGSLDFAKGNPSAALALRMKVTDPSERAKLDAIIGVDPRKARTKITGAKNLPAHNAKILDDVFRQTGMTPKSVKILPGLSNTSMASVDNHTGNMDIAKQGWDDATREGQFKQIAAHWDSVKPKGYENVPASLSTSFKGLIAHELGHTFEALNGGIPAIGKNKEIKAAALRLSGHTHQAAQQLGAQPWWPTGHNAEREVFADFFQAHVLGHPVPKILKDHFEWHGVKAGRQSKINESLRAATVAMLESVRSTDEAVAILEAGSYDEGKHPRDDQGQWVDTGTLSAAKGNPALSLALRAKVTDPTERAKLDAIIGVDPRKVVKTDRMINVHEIASVPNEVQDHQKVRDLAASMENNGWRGDPILATYDSENESYNAITGSHRIAAARKVGIQVPIRELDSDKLKTAAESLQIDMLRMNDEDRIRILSKAGYRDESYSLSIELGQRDSPIRESATGRECDRLLASLRQAERELNAK